MPPGRRMPFSSSLRHALTSFVLDLRNCSTAATRSWSPSLQRSNFHLWVLKARTSHCCLFHQTEQLSIAVWLWITVDKLPKMPIRIWVNSDIYKNYLTCDLSAALNRFQNEEASQPAGTSPSSLGSTSTVFSPPLPEVPQVKHAEPNQETGKVDATGPKHCLIMAEIRRSPVEVGSLSHYLQGFCTIPGGAGFQPSTVSK